MTGTALAVALSVASAFAYALGAVLQQRHADRPTRALLRTPLWWVAIGLNGVGAVLHVVALPYGPLMLVQSFGVLTLALAVPFGAMAERRRVTRTDGIATAMVMAGLLGVLLLIGSGAGASALGTGELIALLLATTAALTALGHRGHLPGASGLWLALAGGIAFGVSSAVTQTITVHVSAGGLAALTQPGVIIAALAVAALSTAGLMFAQRSYRSGLGAPLAVGNIANPVAAAAIGVLLLGEGAGIDGTGAAFAFTAAAVTVVGVYLLSSASHEPSTTAQAVFTAPTEPLGVTPSEPAVLVSAGR